MKKKKSKLQISCEKAEVAMKMVNNTKDELGKNTYHLYNTITELQDLFDKIRNIPSDKMLQYETLKNIRLSWQDQAKKIEKDYNNAVAKNVGQGAVGLGAGVAVAAIGPTAAMGIATTFGVASTGTAISALSGAAATNAALAWLGGGALAAGGGGIAAGNALLALAGPVGWTIAGVALLGSGILFCKSKIEKKSLENIFTLISERDVKSYELAVVELNERIRRITTETEMLRVAIEKTKSYGLDYDKMTEDHQYELGAYVNLMSSSTQLLVNPILGLQPRYCEMDYDKYIINNDNSNTDKSIKEHIIFFANLLYAIDLNDKDRKLLWKSFRKNKKFLASINLQKKEFDFSIIDTACEAVQHKGIA